MTALRDQLARFHAAVTGRAPLDSARDLVEAGRVAGGTRIDELERLHVYEHAYTARIASVLVNDYPKLARLVGEDVLRSWTARYLRVHPPSNFSLREVGAELATWLVEADLHGGGHGEGSDLRWPLAAPRLLADLARLERARTEVFDGPDPTPLSRDDLAMLDPVEFPSLRLQLVPPSRVVELETNADDVWDAIENDRDPSDLALPNDTRSTRVVLVWRRELTVIHRTLESDEARIVSTMVDGTTFGAACELLDQPAERAIELLVRWLDAQVLQRT